MSTLLTRNELSTTGNLNITIQFLFQSYGSRQLIWIQKGQQSFENTSTRELIISYFLNSKVLEIPSILPLKFTSITILTNMQGFVKRICTYKQTYEPLMKFSVSLLKLLCSKN